MKKCSFLAAIVLIFASSVFGQEENVDKIKKLKFCGYKIDDSGFIRKQFEPQLNFLRINDGDTVIDVGTSSGSYIGALNVIGPFKKAHFILVDIDSNCLNPVKVKNMVSYYEGLRGAPFANTFSLVLNTPDSLYLPLKRYKKIWIMNTLHEIDDKVKIIKQMAAVLQSGGELIVAEMPATAKITMHGGCHKLLMSIDEIIALFTGLGFKFDAKENLQVVQKQKDKHPYYFFRFILM